MPPKKSRDRKRQTKLNFSPATASSPTTTAAAAAATPTKPSSTMPAATSSKTRPSRARFVQEDSTSEDELAGDIHRSMRMGLKEDTKTGMFDSSDVDMPTEESSEEEEEERQEYKATHRAACAEQSRQAIGSEDGDTESEEEEESEPEIVVTGKKRGRKDSEDEDEDDELRVPTRKRRRTTRKESLEEEDDDDEVPVSSSRRRRVATPKQRKSRRAKEPIQVSSGSEEDEEDEEEDGVDGEQRGHRNSSEEEDLQEDLAYLQSSPVQDRGKLQSTHEKSKNARQRALEALKKRRASTQEPSSSATPSRARRVIESESETDLEIIKEEQEGSDEHSATEDHEESFQESDRDANAYDMFQEDGDDAGFIDDAEAISGQPAFGIDDMMPLIAARLSVAKPKELFKYAIEWMVMKKIHPAFDSESEVYDITFRKLNDEVKGLANSKFSSSAWTPDFSRALRARPELMISDIPYSMRDIMSPHCEACNRRNHPASKEHMLTGHPYDINTLEPLVDDSSDSESNDADPSSSSPSSSSNGSHHEKTFYNTQGNAIPPESKRFALGSTCSANAHVAHALHHWRYHLYDSVKDLLTRDGHLKPDKLVKRDKMSDNKKNKEARKIVKKMQEQGQIEKLYRQYRDRVEYAMQVVNEGNRGWGRR